MRLTPKIGIAIKPFSGPYAMNKPIVNVVVWRSSVCGQGVYMCKAIYYVSSKVDFLGIVYRRKTLMAL